MHMHMPGITDMFMWLFQCSTGCKLWQRGIQSTCLDICVSDWFMSVVLYISNFKNPGLNASGFLKTPDLPASVSGSCYKENRLLVPSCATNTFQNFLTKYGKILICGKYTSLDVHGFVSQPSAVSQKSLPIHSAFTNGTTQVAVLIQVLQLNTINCRFTV